MKAGQYLAANIVQKKNYLHTPLKIVDLENGMNHPLRELNFFIVRSINICEPFTSKEVTWTNYVLMNTLNILQSINTFM